MKNVAIVGLADTGRDAPWDDPTWEVWGLNGGHLRTPGFFVRVNGARFGGPRVSFRADRWFQIHPPTACDLDELDWFQRLNDGDVPPVRTYVRPVDLAYWSKAYPQAAAAQLLVPFPIDVVRHEFAGGWFANTFCLEAALAIAEGATAIGFFGVECGGYGRELAVERPAVAEWIGICRGLGLTVHLPHACTLTYGKLDDANPIYGFDYFTEARRAAELTALLLPPLPDLDTVNLDTPAAVAAAEDAVLLSEIP